ncbi:helix-turn-helix transcriptional regulator [Streptomyces sp. NPDC048213]|uniref:helix-turn-helix domain-containing protein n=1 Tax=unclassified Streptomyces TaxID=2593676 RepID=UPI0033CCF505
MSEDSERLAQALIQFREAEGISERELAHRTGLSRATIRLHESDEGRLPLPFAARRFEEVLGLPPGSVPARERETTSLELPPDPSAAAG